MWYRVLELAHECDTMLVVGSSLMVYSAFRLSKAAKAGSGRLAILSAGPTRADDLADLKVHSSLQDADRRQTPSTFCMLPCFMTQRRLVIGCKPWPYSAVLTAQFAAVRESDGSKRKLHACVLQIVLDV